VRPRSRQPVRLLMLGWNRRAPRIIRQLDTALWSSTGLASSRIDVLAEGVSGETIEKLRTDLNHADLTVRNADPTDCDVLSSLDLPGYRHIIMLSNEAAGVAHADFRSLVTLLQLRDLERRHGRPFGITGEIADEHTLALAPVTEADDFIVSKTMISNLMTQVAMNPDAVPVFTELFNADGNEIMLRPAGDYVTPGRPVAFATVVESARRQDQVAIGYRRGSERATYLNPDRSALLTPTESDDIIVIAAT
jgi:ion channel POLLUX/CASTOR